MLKSYQREILILQKSIDLLVVVLAWFLAYWARFDFYQDEYSWYLKFTILLLIIQYYFFRKLGLYESQRLKHSTFEVISILKANIIVISVFVLCIYFFSAEKISRVVLVNYSLFSTTLLLIERIILRSFLEISRRKGKNLRHVVLCGNGKQLEDYVKAISSNTGIGIKIKGWVDSGSMHEKYKLHELPMSYLLDYKKNGIDYLVVGYPMNDFSKTDAVLHKVAGDLINISVLPDLSFALIGHEIGEFAGLPIININQPKFGTKSIIAKRLFDITISFLGLVIFSPVLLILALGVKLTSSGPILFTQRRVGLDGREFLMWKFRSMKVDAEVNGNGWTTENDPRKTKFGSFLRKTSLDELPQLWNLFTGHMSLVGPRPEQPFFVEKFKEEIPAYMLRHKMKAGITGWAQVNGWRGDTSITARIECDIWYIKNWSLWLDLEILIMTLWRGFKNAY